MSEKPTFVLVPGAWSLPHVFDKLRSILSDKDYPSEAPAHPSVGTEPPTAALADDVDHLRNVIRGLIEQEKEVIVVMHSYGGLVGSGAVEGLSKDQMAAEGKIGGVICLVYMAAMMVPVGMSPKDLMGGDFLPFMRVEVCCPSVVYSIRCKAEGDILFRIHRATTSTAPSTTKIPFTTSRPTSAGNGPMHSLTLLSLASRGRRRSSPGVVCVRRISCVRTIELSRLKSRRPW